jgi:hypothetical protein
VNDIYFKSKIYAYSQYWVIDLYYWSRKCVQRVRVVTIDREIYFTMYIFIIGSDKISRLMIIFDERTYGVFPRESNKETPLVIALDITPTNIALLITRKPRILTTSSSRRLSICLIL